MKYLGIKVVGFDYWIWFEKTKVEEEDGYFCGKTGWGKNGTCTDLSIPSRLIEGRMESQNLQL